MSNNPFRDDVPIPPDLQTGTGYPPGTNPLLAPAVILIVLAAMFAGLLTLSLPGQILRMREIDSSTPEGMGELTGAVVALVLCYCASGIVIGGAVAMLRQKNYSTAMIGAIVALIPFCSPCFVLGIPFGIWALVLLRREDVRRRFT